MTRKTSTTGPSRGTTRSTTSPPRGCRRAHGNPDELTTIAKRAGSSRLHELVAQYVIAPTAAGTTASRAIFVPS